MGTCYTFRQKLANGLTQIWIIVQNKTWVTFYPSFTFLLDNCEFPRGRSRWVKLLFLSANHYLLQLQMKSIPPLQARKRQEGSRREASSPQLTERRGVVGLDRAPLAHEPALPVRDAL